MRKLFLSSLFPTLLLSNVSVAQNQGLLQYDTSLVNIKLRDSLIFKDRALKIIQTDSFTVYTTTHYINKVLDSIILLADDNNDKEIKMEFAKRTGIDFIKIFKDQKGLRETYEISVLANILQNGSCAVVNTRGRLEKSLKIQRYVQWTRFVPVKSGRAGRVFFIRNNKLLKTVEVDIN